ncbi:MAG: hypothetical protein Q9171_004042 [Xanthocarpia ochracea]
MAASRDERFLMRQRGAGTRDINLTFDLQLPPILSSPLKSHRSGGSVKLLQSAILSPRVTYKTPSRTGAIQKPASKHTPETAKRATHQIVVDGELDRRFELPKNATAPDISPRDSERVPTKKRKNGPNTLEGVAEAAEMPPVKRRRRRKSIAQGSIRKRPRAPALAKEIDQSSKGSIKPIRDEVVPSEVTQPATETTDKASDIPSEPELVRDTVEDLNVAQKAKQPKRRKRKSIGQQRPKKKPKLKDESAVQAELDDIDQQLVPVVANDAIGNGLQIVEKPKPQRRKRNAITETSNRREQPSRVVPLPPTVALKLKFSSVEPTPDRADSNNVAADQPKKRGRKPRTVVSGAAETSKKVLSRPSTVPGVQASQDEPPPLRTELEPQADKASTVPKQRRKKRKSICQRPIYRKRPATKPRGGPDLDLNLADGKTAKTRRAAAAISSSNPLSRSFPEKSQLLPTQVESTQLEPEHDDAVQAPAPKKRGRPRKVHAAPQAAEIAKTREKEVNTKGAEGPEKRKEPRPKIARANETTPSKASQPTNDKIVPAQPPRGRTKKITEEVAQDNSTEALPEISYAPITEPGHRLPSPVLVKKRGRPKKQVANAPVAEKAPRENSTSQLRRTKTRSEDAPSEVPPDVIPSLQTKPLTALTLPDVEDVDQDPLSECTPLQPPHQLKFKPVKPRTQIRPQVTSHPPNKHENTVSDRSDLNEPPVLKVTKRRAKALDKESAPPMKHKVLTTHALTRQSQGIPDLELPSYSPLQHQENRTDFESHIQQSSSEENALPTDQEDQEELQVQRAQEIAEQKERDLNVQLERLSASVKKRKQQQQAFASNKNDSLNISHDKATLGVKKKARGLENLFRTVSGTKKRNGGEIDPDLQGILDQVKGVGRRDGCVMKIF